MSLENVAFLATFFNILYVIILVFKERSLTKINCIELTKCEIYDNMNMYLGNISIQMIISVLECLSHW